MNAAKIPFAAMQYFGIWRPKTWTSEWAIKFYNVYSVSIVVILIMFAASLLMYILRGAEDLEALTENLIMFCGVFALETCCIPRNLQECDIQGEFERHDRSFSIFILTTCFIGVIVITLSPLKTLGISLPCDKVWIPYNIESNRLLFWLTYVYQTFSLFTLGFLTCSFDCFISTMMQQICTQLQIFECRLNMLPKLLEENHEKAVDDQWVFKIIKDWVVHQTHVYSIGSKLNDIFSLPVFTQFFVTILAFCTIIYQLATLTVFSLKFWYMVGCLNNYMVEIFLYCWYGEKMIQMSVNAAEIVYKVDWNSLTLNSKKCLVLIMIRARRPIELIGASMVTMSIDTLVKILKTSYSTFSVLKSSSNGN